jgi:hypothetical protein
MYTGDDESPTLGGGHWKVYLRMYMGDDALYAEGEYLWKPSMNSMGGNRCYSGFETCFCTQHLERYRRVLGCKPHLKSRFLGAILMKAHVHVNVLVDRCFDALRVRVLVDGCFAALRVCVLVDGCFDALRVRVPVLACLPYEKIGHELRVCLGVGCVADVFVRPAATVLGQTPLVQDLFRVKLHAIEGQRHSFHGRHERTPLAVLTRAQDDKLV